MAGNGRPTEPVAKIIERHGGEIRTGPFGTALNAREYTATGTPVVAVRDIGYGRLELDEKTPRVPDDVVERLSIYKLEAGDILFGRKGAVDLAALVQDDQAGWLMGSDCIRLRLPTALDNRFVNYCFQSRAHKAWMERQATGSTMPSLNQKIIERIPIPIRPLSEQKAIAEILGALDAKIELNRRMNLALESLARCLFKSWFVDFDPVRAKMDGRLPPGLSPATAALFPDKLEHSNGELIPVGWRMGRLDDLLILQRGFDLPKKDRTPGAFPVFAAGGHHGTHAEWKVNGPGVVTGRSGVLGNVYYVHEDFWPLNTTLWIKEFRASRPIHAYHFLRTMALEGFNAGSAVPTLNRNHVHGFPVIVPRLEVVERFEEFAKPLFERSRQNARESETLAALRDTLLPRLLSGELRVAAAERLVQGTSPRNHA